MEDGLYRDLIIIYPKPYSIHLRGIIGFNEDRAQPFTVVFLGVSLSLLWRIKAVMMITMMMATIGSPGILAT